MKIWGKSKDGDREVSLSKHINDTLEVFKIITPYVKSEYLQKIIEIVIQYHDSGKVLPYFQRKILGNTNYQPIEVYTNIPHSLLSALLVDESALKEKLREILNDQQKVDTYTKYVISSIAYHHWRETFFDMVEGYTDVFEQLYHLVLDDNKWSQIDDNIKQIYSEIESEININPSINEKWLEGLNNGIRFADYVVPPYLLYRMPKRIEMDTATLKDWILISGFTMICDHFASYIESDPEEKISTSNVEIKGPNYLKIKEQVVYELKCKLGQNYNKDSIWQFQQVDRYKESNTILLAPTGVGKTEFSYLWSNGEKFFYTLPLRTAVNQIFERTKRIFGENETGILHSDADVYILGGEGEESESMRIYDFARQLASSAIVSTGDQFFPYALRPPAYEKIFAKFSYSRLIIDEVQAYDPKAAAIVVKFIEHVVQMGGKFLLMTATLPGFIRKELENRINISDLKTLDLFSEDVELAKFSKHNVQLLVDDYRENQYSYNSAIIQNIIEKANSNRGSRILVIMNTVKQAQVVFNDLKIKANNKIEVKLFHSHFTQSDRKKREDELNAFIGNNDISRKEKRAKILVATQVVEASLDLDADYLYTELSPWDSLVQRMGRVFREYRNTSPNAINMISRRYNQKEIPQNVFLLAYNGTKNGKNILESGQGYVYNEDLLKITLKLFEDKNADFDKWFKKAQFDFKKLDGKTLLLSDGDKNELVNLLFDKIPSNSKYFSKFNDMLQLLDAGFMSDRKSDAQKAFREINNVNVIAENKKEMFFNDIAHFEFNQCYAYTKFKKEILSKYLLSVQISKVKEYIYESNLVVVQTKARDILEDCYIQKIVKWMSSIYFVNLDYSDEGLVGLKEMPSFNDL